MSLRPRLNALVTVAAAYAVALQGLLIAAGMPFAAQPQFAAQSLCSSASAGHATQHPGTHCPGGCFGACCGATPSLVPALAAIQRVPSVIPRVALIASPLLPPLEARANRSRAPPRFA